MNPTDSPLAANDRDLGLKELLSDWRTPFLSPICCPGPTRDAPKALTDVPYHLTDGSQETDVAVNNLSFLDSYWLLSQLHVQCLSREEVGYTSYIG